MPYANAQNVVISTTDRHDETPLVIADEQVKVIRLTAMQPEAPNMLVRMRGLDAKPGV
jgi:hypothetical protein